MKKLIMNRLIISLRLIEKFSSTFMATKNHHIFKIVKDSEISIEIFTAENLLVFISPKSHFFFILFLYFPLKLKRVLQGRPVYGEKFARCTRLKIFCL